MLKPAYISQENQYHYYAAEQLPILDTILLCINLGLPLKEMKRYIDSEGNLNADELLLQGKTLAQKHIQEIQTQLRTIEHSLNRLQSDKGLTNRNGVYTRRIECRHIVTSPTFQEKLEVGSMEVTINQLFTRAQADFLAPIMPAGLMLRHDGKENFSHCFFLEIANAEASQEQIITLPAGDYACLQMDMDNVSDIYETASNIWGADQEMTVIVSNIYKKKFSLKNRPAEFQRPL